MEQTVKDEQTKDVRGGKTKVGEAAKNTTTGTKKGLIWTKQMLSRISKNSL